MGVHVISLGVVDYLGDRKTIALYLPDTTTVATINTVLSTFLPALDDVIDGKIDSASVQFGLTLPGGLKGSAIVGKDVHNGANLTFDVTGSDYSHSIYVPTWEEAGFAGQSVLITGDYDTLEGEIVADNFTDRDGLGFDSFTSGLRVRRK
jgi:hypothetical protein